MKSKEIHNSALAENREIRGCLKVQKLIYLKESVGFLSMFKNSCIR